MIFEDDDFEPIREHLARNIGYRFRDRGLGRGCPLREGKRPGGLRRERRDERNNKRENYKDSFHINSALLFKSQQENLPQRQPETQTEPALCLIFDLSLRDFLSIGSDSMSGARKWMFGLTCQNRLRERAGDPRYQSPDKSEI